MNLVVIVCSIFLIRSSDSAKILAVFPTGAPSHYILGNALLRGLAEAGHDVTMISPFTESNPPKAGSWRDIVLTGFLEEHRGMGNRFDAFMSEEKGPILSTLLLTTISGGMTDKTFNHTNVQNLLNSNEQFDVVIVGQFLNDAVKAFAAHFNAHLIIFSSVYANSMINHLVGNPSLPSFAPEVFSNFPPRMSFFQRLYNTAIKFTFVMANNLVYYPTQDKLIKKYFKNPVDLDDVMYNVSLILLNSHPSIATPQPYVPCMIDIGGFHIKPPKQLPAELQTYLDNAKEGVIYFSMGSNLKSTNIPSEKRDAILKSFSKLKEKVLWKWEDDVLPGQPPNVRLGKWLPQQEILAHPNVKAFITHGGLLSTIETVHHGVPIIAIPIFGDQKVNANSAKIAGYGTILPFKELTEETLSWHLKEILTNPKYREEAQRRSRITKDRQVKPLDNAIYWVEYVIRHNGAKHLRVPYLDLTWYQYYLLDVFAFILIVIVGAYFILKKLLFYFIKRVTKTKLKKN